MRLCYHRWQRGPALLDVASARLRLIFALTGVICRRQTARTEPGIALVIVPHPDDADFLAAGTIAAWDARRLAGHPGRHHGRQQGHRGPGHDPRADHQDPQGGAAPGRRPPGHPRSIVFLGYEDGLLEDSHHLREDLTRLIRSTGLAASSAWTRRCGSAAMVTSTTRTTSPRATRRSPRCRCWLGIVPASVSSSPMGSSRTRSPSCTSAAPSSPTAGSTSRPRSTEDRGALRAQEPDLSRGDREDDP